LHTPESGYHHFDRSLYPFPEGFFGKSRTAVNPSPVTGKGKSGHSKQNEPEKSDVELRPKLILASDVKKKAIKWLWENKILRGSLSLITGLGGVTKTYWTVYMASRITNGWDWADGSPCELGSILFFHGEEGIADLYMERFEANGVDRSKVVFWDGMVDENNERSEVDVSLKMVDKIENAIKSTAERTGVPVQMVVVDPIANFWGGVNENSNADVRSVLRRLQRLAEKMDVAFIMIQHTGKSGKSHAQQKVLGSTGIVAACRAVWGVFVDPDDKDIRLFAPVKVNFGYDHTAVSYRIVAPGGRVEIIDGSIPDLTADDIESAQQAARREARSQRPTKRDECASWLWTILAEGDKPAKEIYEWGRAKGFSERTIDRVKAELKIESKRVGFGDKKRQIAG
jgi:KaiC/GvpD/RAD55 family RecA-like ATPase